MKKSENSALVRKTGSRFISLGVSLMTAFSMLGGAALPTGEISADAADTVKIMPLGDSITFGMADDGGYRKFLDYFLKEKGYSNIDFVGPEGADSASFNYNGKSVTYDDNHAGYSGYTITDLPGGWFGQLNGIYETMQKGDYIKKYSPDIILLQIGTNDVSNGHLDGSEERLHTLLDYLLENMNGTIFLTTIPDLGGSFMGGGNTNADIASYNQLVKKVAGEYSGKRVIYADIHSVIDGSKDLADGVHPNSGGYEKMGKYWADILDDYLSGQTTPSVTPTSPSVTPPSGSSSGMIFHDTFENSTDSWTARGNVTLARESGLAVEGGYSLAVTGRNDSWNGAYKELSTSDFTPGKAYSFSVYVMQRAAASDDFKLTLQYSDGVETRYDSIATVTASKAEWAQLSNTSYLIPEGARDMQLVVETADSTNSFYFDEASAAPGGTSIVSNPTMPQGVLELPGDVNMDGTVDTFDLVFMRKGLINGFGGNLSQFAADIDQSGDVKVNDAVQLADFLTGKIKTFRVVDKPQPTTQPPTEPPVVIKDNKWDSYQETADSKWIDFYKSSIYSMGNTYRLTKKLEEAENGKKLTMAYLGGSITEMGKYTGPFSNYVKTNFAKGGFTEVNAGLSGTSSVVGLVRSEPNVISKEPDIVFVEFSVNDHEDIMYKKCFESVIKRFLDMPNEPAVIILIHRAKSGFSSQAQMVPVGENFDIPIISMDNALTKAFNSGFLSSGDYFTDDYHPHDKGGQLVSDCLAYFFRQAMKTENRSSSYTVPTKSVYGTEYENCSYINPKDMSGFNAGSWSAGGGYNGGQILPYSYNLNGGSPMAFKTEGKGLIIVFKANSSGMGSIDVTVNGKTTKVNGNKQYCWGGPDAELGYYQDTTGQLDVSIKGSGSFTIWGIGLIK